MPRAASSAKRQHHGSSNHRDPRPPESNGLVGPGKRISRRKSQGLLDGAARDHAAAAAATAPACTLPTMPPPVEMPPSLADGFTHEMGPEHRTTGALRRGSLGTNSESSSADSLASPPAAPSTATATSVEEGHHHHHHHHHHQQRYNPHLHRSINVNDAKNSGVHRDPGPLDLAFTVLRSCPLHDTIAILIILMQVPPVALTFIYMLFTLLTFVPPVTTSSGLSITEIFDGNQGTPSLSTLLCMDVVMLLIWVFLWAPVQQFILDLAQVVISLTLGGGSSSRQGTANNIVLGVTVVGLSHWSRCEPLSRLLLPLDSIVRSSSRFFAPDAAGGNSLPSLERKDSHNWIRSVLAIHILTQGLVRYIREWYLRREKRDLLSQSQQDPEAGKASSLAAAAPGTETPGDAALDTDGSQHNSTAVLSSKKRRKQSAQVRIRQPLWAALASTKIVMVKEYELSHAASESAGSHATDIHNLGNAPFNTQPEQIWICYVGCDEVCFSTSYFPEPADPLAESPRYDEDARSSGIDPRKPFYVRVNNAVWQPARILPIEEGAPGTRWTGDIYGLTPLSSYECEFVSTRTGAVLFSTSVRTVEAPTTSRDTETATPKAAAAAAGNKPSHVRHDSPATTLRASIAAAEAKLADEKARLKASRKDNNRRANAVRKEIEKLTAAAQSAGGNDEKLRQKIAQNEIRRKQAGISAADVEDQLKELETVPEALLERYRGKQSSWSAEKARFDGARAAFKSFKGSIDKEIKGLGEEKASLEGKRNKIASRIAKVDDEHARITDANARGLDEAERRRQSRLAQEADAHRVEQHVGDRAAKLRAVNADKQAHIQSMAAQMRAYLSSFQDEPGHEKQVAVSQPPPPSSSSIPPSLPAQFNPVVPWAPPTSAYSTQPMWAPTLGATPLSGAPTAQAPLAHQFSPFSNPLQPAFGTPPQHKTRGRSSSMLSDVSGFTQSTDDDNERASSSHAAAATTPAGPANAAPGSGRPLPKLQGTPGSVARGAPGYALAQRGDGLFGSGPGSAVGSGSSMRSGSGSGSSLRDPTSPV